MTRALFSLQRESAGARLLARAVLTTWLLPLFFALLTSLAMPPTPAQAQQGIAQTVIVLDFAVSGGLDPLLGRKAADGLAVELQRSGEYDVVPRQRVEEAVDQQAGLQPPFNDIAQIKLAQTVNARSVFSGRVQRVDVSPGRSARVTIEARQLEVLTGDFINGTVVTESTEQKLGSVASEILVDEAINKAVFAAVRSMRQTKLPDGVVLNTARDTVELNIGAQAGVVSGQRYSVLRDIYDRARNVTERQKIGELRIVRVGSDQSTAELSAGGQQGVTTGDHVRQIFEPGRYPTTAVSNGNISTTPVTAPVARSSSGGGGFLKSSASGLYGLLGLALLAGFAGFGGNDGNNSPPSATNVTEANPTQILPNPRIAFKAGFSGINLAQTLDRESVVAYIIYRGESPDFVPDISNVQAVIDASVNPANSTIFFNDPGVTGNTPFRRATFTAVTTSQGAVGNSTVNSTIQEVAAPENTIPLSQIVTTPTSLTISFRQLPLEIGQPYYYRIGRISAVRSRTTDTGTTGTGATAVTFLPLTSPVSNPVGSYTPLFLPNIIATSGNTDNFTVTINTDLTPFGQFGIPIVDANGMIIGFTGFTRNAAYAFPAGNNANVGAGVNQFRFEVSTTPSFARSATFVSPDIPNPMIQGQNTSITLDLGNASNIRIPSSPSNPYIPGVTPLFVRVLSRNTNDSNSTFRISSTFTLQNAGGLDRTATSSRFLSAPGGGAGQGINIGSGGNLSRTQGGSSSSPRVLAPR